MRTVLRKGILQTDMQYIVGITLASDLSRYSLNLVIVMVYCPSYGQQDRQWAVL